MGSEMCIRDSIKAYMDRRFTDEIGQPYKRYRNFVNICALQVPSTPICGSSAFGCCGDDQSRLANCNDTKVNNAVKMYERGTASIESIDAAMCGGCGFPMGPFALLDLIGLDTSVAILDTLHAEFGDANYVPAMTLRRMASAGRLGRKTGWGFHRY